MKRYICIIFLFVFNYVNAQLEDDFIYVSSGLNFGNHFGIDLNLNFILNEEYSLMAGFAGGVKSPGYMPKEYKPGLFGSGPFDHFRNYHFLVGKIISLTGGGRVNILAGAGYTSFMEPGNWEKINASNFLSKNYDYVFNKFNSISFTFNPKLEFPLSDFHGINLSGLLVLTKSRKYMGVGLTVMLGKVR